MTTLPSRTDRTPRLSTEAVHAGENRPYPHHALTLPIFDTSTYTFENTADLRQFMEARMWGLAEGRVEYGRYGNPTIFEVEARVAALSGGEGRFSSLPVWPPSQARCSHCSMQEITW